MSYTISPKYKMELVGRLEEKILHIYPQEEDVRYYIEAWQIKYDCYGNSLNFDLQNKADSNCIDLRKTLHRIDDETLLKIAIDLGLETPGFIPSIPMFRNELKSTLETASQIFEKAIHEVENDPSNAVLLANTALESICKEILKDKRVSEGYDNNKKKTSNTLVGMVCKVFKCDIEDFLDDYKKISNILNNLSSGIGSLRNDKTLAHGKTDGDMLISDPIYAYLVINSVSSVGLFFLNLYKKHYPKEIDHSKNFPF